MLRNLNRSASGRRIAGTPHVGVLAAAIPTTGDYPAFGLNDIDAGDPADCEYRVQILTWPAVGTLLVAEDTSFTYEPPAPDYVGVVSGTQRVWKNGVAVYDETYSFTYGSSSTVSSDLVGAYAVQALVSSDLAASYAIGATVSVSADLSASYAVTMLVSADLVGAYSISSPASLVSADLAGAYSVSAYVSANLAATYAVNSNTTYARAPAGDGYRPARAASSIRPAAVQRNTR